MVLARHLRWEVEEDLSRVLGDVAAHRLASTGRALVAWHLDALERVAGAIGDYLIDEKRVLARASSSMRSANRSRNCATASQGSTSVSSGLARLARLLRIIAVGLRQAAEPEARPDSTRGLRLRRALETLGPISVKFGQILSTRRDLVPLDIADELARLQDRVPPFASRLQSPRLNAPRSRLEAVFESFERTPVASASIAQVHLARLHDGTEVAVKVLRPGIERAVARDLELLETGAALVERLGAMDPGLPREVVAEFARHLDEELDLMREAANASQLRRNFDGSPLLLVPAVYWDLCAQRVMVMERMHGTPISQVQVLREKGVDILRSPALAWRSSSRRSATGSSTPTCTPETSSSRTTGGISRSTSASWEPLPRSTRTTSRRTSSRSSTATTAA